MVGRPRFVNAHAAVCVRHYPIKDVPIGVAYDEVAVAWVRERENDGVGP